VFGDVHGQCDTLVKFLINNHIIDKSLRWCFGKGHIVFLGDIFDRGEKVTEALWLLYRLENEAAQEGGGVHLLLGNHEIMNLFDDNRYLADKYFYLFEKLHLDYHEYYSKKTIMGQWLRSKNAILKINDILFVHGGIHPDLLKYNVSLDSVNYSINKYLVSRHPGKLQSPLIDFLVSAKGPFWYRGMVPFEGSQNCLSGQEVDQILAYYKVNVIMVGHTTLSHITSFYSGKVYGLDVPFYRIPGKPMQAIYIDPSGFYRTFSNGETEKLN